jgi:hypothetical protein
MRNVFITNQAMESFVANPPRILVNDHFCNSYRSLQALDIAFVYF